jgi:hypothetical protein
MTNQHHNHIFLQSITVNDDGIVIDYPDLHRREKRWAIGFMESRLLAEFHGNTDPEEMQAFIESALHGLAQSRYDRIMEEREAKRKSDWDRYY